MDVLNARLIAIGEWQPTRLQKMREDRAQVLTAHGLARRRARDGVEDFGRRRRGSEARWTRAREETRHELGAIRREFEERLVRQMQIEVAAANVHDERHGGPGRGDVRVVLFGSDADIGAARHRDLKQRGNDRLKFRFVRDQILGMKRSVRLGES